MTAPKVEGHCDPKFSKLADIFSASIKSGFDDGGSLCLEIENEVVVDMWGGFKDQEHTKSWDENTIANVFSVTKAMTATCALKLLEDKRINLGDRVTRYWPEYDCKSKGDTTIKDFFSHRAGMFGFQEPLPYECWEDWDLIVNQLAKQEPFHKPGTAQGYHAMTFGFLLGEIIRRVDGRSVGTFFKEEIADVFDVDFKIGLQESDFERCADLIMQEAPINVINFFRRIPRWLLPSRIRMIGDTLSSTEYRKAFIEILRTEDQKVQNVTAFPNTPQWRKAEIPAANGHGTARGVAKFFSILSNGGSRDGKSLLKQETIDLATTEFSTGPDKVLFQGPYKFGLGYMLDAPLSPIGLENTMFGHTGIGGAAGFGDKVNKIGFAFVNNRQHGIGKLYKTANNLTKSLYKGL